MLKSLFVFLVTFTLFVIFSTNDHAIIGGYFLIISAIALIVFLFKSLIKIINQIKKAVKNKNDNIDLDRPTKTKKYKKEPTIRKDSIDYEIERIPRIDPLVSTVPVNTSDIDVITDVDELNVTSTTNVADLFPLCVIDVETTGLNKWKDKIIQVSIIKYDAVFNPIEMINQYVNPGIDIPYEIEKLTDISNELVSIYPTIEYLADGISDFIKGCNIAGHNVKFDVGFLSAAGVRFDDKTIYIDSLAMCRKMYKSYKTERFKHKSNNFHYDVENYKLDTMLAYYNIHRSSSHRADSDAYCTGLLLEKLFNDIIDS